MPEDIKPNRRQQSHERILDAAARALCRDGCSGVGVAGVMKEAGLTHGGFYAHFESRDALLAEAVERAGVLGNERLRERVRRRVDAGSTPLRAVIEEYLSELHANATDSGCPVAALGADMGRAQGALREVAARRVRHLVGLVAESLPPGSAPGAAAVIASTVVGAIQMARAFDDGERVAMLQTCREALIAQYDRTGLKD